MMRESIAIVGPGKLGTALERALARAKVSVSGPHGHGFSGDGSPIAILCVPDAAISEAAAVVEGDVLVGHCSGASPLGVVGERPAFGLHPLMTFPGGKVELDGAWCAISGTGPGELEVARRLAVVVGMRPFELDEEHRAAYHAAASFASNFFVTLGAQAERLAAAAGVPTEAFAPLAEASVANWMEVGAERALTGPIARGDEETVARQRAAVEAAAPDMLALFDALSDRTRELAIRARGAIA